MSAADTTLMTRQREMLLQKLDEFERTNKALRRLLREQQATEVLSALRSIQRRKLKEWMPRFLSSYYFRIEVRVTLKTSFLWLKNTNGVITTEGYDWTRKRDYQRQKLPFLRLRSPPRSFFNFFNWAVGIRQSRETMVVAPWVSLW